MGNDDFYYQEVEEICKVYDADDFFTIFVQLLLAFAALISLWFKRHYERPRRKFRTWFLDVAKQGVGACYAHVCNMVRVKKITMMLNTPFSLSLSVSVFLPLTHQSPQPNTGHSCNYY